MTVRGTVAGLAQRAEPPFAAGVVAAPLTALAYAATAGSVQVHTHVHVMAGVLWTGVDLFTALALFTAAALTPTMLLLGWEFDASRDWRWQAWFGVLIPGEVRMYEQMTSANPDAQVIADIGMRNAELGGVKGAFQLAVIATMVYIRYGGF